MLPEAGFTVLLNMQKTSLEQWTKINSISMPQNSYLVHHEDQTRTANNPHWFLKKIMIWFSLWHYIVNCHLINLIVWYGARWLSSVVFDKLWSMWCIVLNMILSCYHLNNWIILPHSDRHIVSPEWSPQSFVDLIRPT